MPTEMFRLIHESSVKVIELTLPETLDSGEFGELNDAISRLFASSQGEQWVLDLSHVSYMGSSALGLIVNMRQQVNESGGRLVLCSLTPRLLQIIHTCCLERLFTIVKTREEARRELSRGRR